MDFMRWHGWRRLFPIVRADDALAVNTNNSNLPPATTVPIEAATALFPEKPKPSLRPVTDADVLEYLKTETGRDRVRDLFGKTDKGEYSTGLQLIMACGSQTALLAGCISSIFGSREGADNFARLHQATKFRTKFLGMRTYYNMVLYHSLKSGLRWSFKIGIFCTSFLMVSQTIAEYRNKTTPLEYGIAGAFTGSIVKLNMGLRGAFVAGLTGGVLGFGFGGIFWAAMYSAGLLQSDRHSEEIKQKLTYRRRMMFIQETGQLPQKQSGAM
ncbi:complex I assembly factor TIMMDC1, mitochondrial-like [Tubulanus polymorphus]|uniref:complex I assembly factor TIMMDC1, mitochondrial-like n=1 Tax=Tubulanus polymorphus TaxID=672921 RepID=UPI003DA436E8